LTELTGLAFESGSSPLTTTPVVGTPRRSFGSGALKNFNGLRLPVTSTTKVFLSHLHADHVGDMPTLVWSLAKAGRRDPVEVWGPASHPRAETRG
jgi:ribonuclease Z